MRRRPERETSAIEALARLLCSVVLLIFAAGCAERGLFTPPTLEPLLPRVDGPWLRDAKGRVVLLRGVNYVRSEVPPEQRVPPREEDFVFLASLGFNLIRLPVSWGDIELRPDAYDLAYLRDHVDPVLRFANNHGMQVVLALQQPRASCVLGPGRAPSWTCTGAEEPPAAPGFGPPGALAEARAARARCRFFRDARASDGRTLREHFVATWKIVAQYYEQDRRIVGFDLFDEPSPDGCLPPETFVLDVLHPFYDQIRAAIREAGAPQAIVVQPAVTRDDPLLALPPTGDPATIVAPHLFGQTFGAPGPDGDDRPLAAFYDRAAELAGRIGGPLLIGEIGADAPRAGGERPATPAFLQESLDQLDRRLIGGAIWAFVPPNDPAADPAVPSLGDPSQVDALARPYARRIAGIPLEMSFDAATRSFLFRFRDDDEVRRPDPTEIFVPAKRRYPDGFDVAVTDGDRWTFDEHTQRLLLYRGSATTHEVRITPAGGAPGPR